MCTHLPPRLHFWICCLSLECFFLQALMTGSIPGFVDVIRNLNSPVLQEDSVIRQAKAAGKRMIFYGHETWLRLFPKHFVEYDGTTSFFVSDYIEVSFLPLPLPNYKSSICLKSSLVLPFSTQAMLFPGWELLIYGVVWQDYKNHSFT